MRFVAEHRDRFGVEPILRVLGIPTSTFYGWVARQRRPSPHQIEEAWLGEQIQRIHTESGKTYGSPKIHAQLRRQGIRCSRKRVERLLRCRGLQGAFMRKRRRSSTRRDPAATPAPDLVNRDFTAPAPNQLWVADISRIPTGEGPLWLASVRDAFSRRVVGWATSERADTRLVLGALDHALSSRQLEPDRLVFHSDHGAQYTAVRFTQRLADAGIAASMGTVGDSLDKALASHCTSWCWLGANSAGEGAAHAFDQAGVAWGGRLVEPLVFVVGLVALEESGVVPVLDGGQVHAELLGEFAGGEHASGAESVTMAGELVEAA
jgi:hypothetical protein